MARQANRKEANYSKSLFNRPSRAVSTRCRRRDVSTQSSTPVDDRLFMRAEMDGAISSYRKCAAEMSRGLSSEYFVAA